MRVAMAQITAGDDPSANLDNLARLVAQAAAGGADLVAFPEATMCRYGVPLAAIAEPLDGPWATRVRELARQHGIAVLVGLFTPGAIGADGKPRVRNTVLVADRDGHYWSYNKIHLYDAFGYRESATVAPGDEALVADLALADGTTVRLGVATCYDVRFPELFGALADAGAQVIAVPTSWATGPGKVEQWCILTSARALDSGAFIVAVDQAPPPGGGDGPVGVGHSRVVGPFGSVVGDEYGDSPQMGFHDLDLAEVARSRDVLGMRVNRRPVAIPGPTPPGDR